MYLRTIRPPAGRFVRETGVNYSPTVTDVRLARDEIYPVVVTNPYDPGTHVAVGSTSALVNNEHRVTYTLKTHAQLEAERQSAKPQALRQAENALLAAPADPATAAEAIQLLKAAIAVLKAGGSLADLPRSPHVIAAPGP